MKNIISLILLLLISSNVFSQKWRDSLMVARNSYKMGDYSKALRYYQSAQKNAPKELDFSDEIAQSAYKSDAFEQAEKIYSAKRNKNDVNQAQTFHNIGNARMKQKNYQGAIDSYKEALRKNSKDEQTRYNLSEAIRQLKNQQKKNNDKKDQKEDPKEDQKKDQNQPPKDKKDNTGKKDNPPPNDKKEEEGNASKLPEKTMDKILDKLLKQEEETKKKIRSTKGNEGESTSGKDW